MIDNIFTDCGKKPTPAYLFVLQDLDIINLMYPNSNSNPK